MTQKKFDKIVKKFNVNIFTGLESFTKEKKENAIKQFEMKKNVDSNSFCDFISDSFQSISSYYNNFLISSFINTLKLYNKRISSNINLTGIENDLKESSITNINIITKNVTELFESYKISEDKIESAIKKIGIPNENIHIYIHRLRNEIDSYNLSIRPFWKPRPDRDITDYITTAIAVIGLVISLALIVKGCDKEQSKPQAIRILYKIIK
jgi:hypothetical protein